MSEPLTPSAATPRGPAAPRGRRFLRGAALVVAGMLIAAALGGALLLADLRLGGRALRAAMGSGDLADACRAPLLRRLAERGFEPAELEFGPEPTLGPAWAAARTFGSSFDFRDGAAGTRVDGVVACAVSASGVAVDFRVSADPHRAA